LWFEAQGGMVRPGVNQIPGTVNDWNTVQNFAALRGPAAQVVLVSDEIPLMQFGGINTGRYNPNAKPESQQIYSWVLNNYWTTNFRASQEGELIWSYALTSGADTSNSFATRFGWGTRVPFAPSSLLLVGTRPAKQGIILHLREVAGHSAMLARLEGAKGWGIEEVDALGGPLRQTTTVTFRPFEVKFVRVWKEK